MSTLITAENGAGTTAPLTVLSPYASQRTSRNVIHDLIGGDIAVSLVPPRPRSGTMSLLYSDEASADAAAELHTHPTAFALTTDDIGTADMTYVVAGDIAVALDERTLIVWTVTIGYQEVGATTVRGGF